MKLFMLVVGMINVASFAWTKSLEVEENKANQFLCAAAEKNSRWQNAKITYITSVKEGFSGPCLIQAWGDYMQAELVCHDLICVGFINGNTEVRSMLVKNNKGRPIRILLDKATKKLPESAEYPGSIFSCP